MILLIKSQSILGMAKSFTFYPVCDHLSMLVFKLKDVSKRGPNLVIRVSADDPVFEANT